MEKLILEKLEQSETGRERFVTTDLNVLKAVRNLGNQGLVQWKVKMQPAQPLGLIVHDDQLNVVSDWAEKMVCQIIGAEQTAWNCKGHDAILPDGTKIEVKFATWNQHKTNKKWKFRFGNLKPSSEFNLLIAGLADLNKPNAITKSTFYVLTSDEVKLNLSGKQNEIYVWENSKLHKKLNQYYKCTLAELAELKHGYDHFLKMKGKVKPVESPKESIQFVVDVWKPNKFGLMPYDSRYEDWSWYWEFVAAYLLGGTVTEQRQSGFDVVDQFKNKLQVKVSKVSNIKRLKDKMVTLNRLKSNSEYDALIGFCWDDYDSMYKTEEVKVIIMPKVVVEILKHPYKKGDYSDGRIYFYVREDGNYTKQSPINRLKPFMFTIDHLVELKEIGYEQFYLKYLKEPCEKVLGVEIKNGSDDSNGNKIDLKPKFPIQFKSSKRTNQADQRSA